MPSPSSRIEVTLPLYGLYHHIALGRPPHEPMRGLEKVHWPPDHCSRPPFSSVINSRNSRAACVGMGIGHGRKAATVVVVQVERSADMDENPFLGRPPTRPPCEMLDVRIERQTSHPASLHKTLIDTCFTGDF